MLVSLIEIEVPNLVDDVLQKERENFTKKVMLSFFTPSCRDYITQHAFFFILQNSGRICHIHEIFFFIFVRLRYRIRKIRSMYSELCN